jgi:hypothetical protein
MTDKVAQQPKIEPWIMKLAADIHAGINRCPVCLWPISTNNRGCRIGVCSYVTDNEAERVKLQARRTRWREIARMIADSLSQRPVEATHAATPLWVIVAEGEGAQAVLLNGINLWQEVHDFMCYCGSPFRSCTTAGMQRDMEMIEDEEAWANDEDGKSFSLTWRHETGRVTLYRLSSVATSAGDRETTANGAIWVPCAYGCGAKVCTNPSDPKARQAIWNHMCIGKLTESKKELDAAIPPNSITLGDRETKPEEK